MNDGKARGIWTHIVRLLRPEAPMIALAVVLGAISGFAMAALLATVNQALHSDAEAIVELLIVFAGLCIVALVGNIVSDISNNVIGQGVIARLRRDLGAKILVAPLAKIEQTKLYRLITILTEDVDTISTFSFISARLLIAVAIIVGSLVYLAVLSLPYFLLAILMIVLGGFAVSVSRNLAVTSFMLARDGEEELQRHYRAVTEGAKEARVNQPRRKLLYEKYIVATVERIRRLQIKGVNYFVGADAFASLLFFLIIGTILAVQTFTGSLDGPTTTGFILVLLFIRGPLEQVVEAMPIIAQTQVAFRKLSQVSDDFEIGEEHLNLDLDLQIDSRDSFETLELRGASYSFPPSKPGASGFTLGPIDLTFRRGEMVFIVGENGCGKTTLIKLLLALYAPKDGEVLLDGRTVTADWRDQYRQRFSAIFFDYYLFDDFTAEQQGNVVDMQRHLDRLDLAHKVSMSEAGFSTTELSTGQRKRLALMHLHLEKRPILVFDEWAAEQDPTYRRLFYTELLPEMKRQGKTLIVISHDDRYFHVADRIIHLDAGRIATEEEPARQMATPYTKGL